MFLLFCLQFTVIFNFAANMCAISSGIGEININWTAGLSGTISHKFLAVIAALYVTMLSFGLSVATLYD